MKNTLFIILCATIFFILGYLYSSRAMLVTEFAEVNSNSLSRIFLERSSLYKLSLQGQQEKIKDILESLIYSDLVAMGMIDLSRTSNSEILCAQLNQLQALVKKNVSFSDELANLLKECL